MCLLAPKSVHYPSTYYTILMSVITATKGSLVTLAWDKFTFSKFAKSSNLPTLATDKTWSIKLILWRGSLVLIVVLLEFPLPWGLLLFLKALFLDFNWLFLGKWFLGILLLAEIRFTLVVELPLLSCVMSASCPLASSSTWMRVIKVSKDVFFCLCHKVFWNSLQDVVVYQLCQLPPNCLKSLWLWISILPQSFGSLMLDPPPIFYPPFGNEKIY